MGEYRISELVARSGFPASTLRFYEQAGLLAAARSPGGYRLYGDDALDRLGFIAAAKSLGLALEEIRELLGVWQHGVCADVRTRLRPLVAARIGEAQLRIAELSAFVAALSGVHDELGGPAPDGPCGPGCGCVSTERRGPMLLELGPTARRRSPTEPGPPQPADARQQETPVACTLGGTEQAVRRAEWAQLLASATTREPTSDGVRVSFPLDTELAGRVARLAGAEQSCCAFLAFTMAFSPSTLVMTVSASPVARPVLADLFGAQA